MEQKKLQIKNPIKQEEVSEYIPFLEKCIQTVVDEVGEKLEPYTNYCYCDNDKSNFVIFSIDEEGVWITYSSLFVEQEKGHCLCIETLENNSSYGDIILVAY